MIRKLIVIPVFFILFGICFAESYAAGSPSRRVVFIGDSVTDGNWGDGGGGKPSSARNHWDQNHLYGSGYMYLSAAHYPGRHPDAELRFFNRGISGNTLTDLERRWEEDVLRLDPDLVSMMIGINDIERFVGNTESALFDFARREEDYRRLLDRTLEQNPRVRFVPGAPFVSDRVRSERFAGGGYTERGKLVERCALIVKRIAADHGAIFLPYDTPEQKVVA